MLRDLLSLLVALGGVALTIGMYLRIHAFSRSGREAITASFIGLFVVSKYIGYATNVQDYLLAAVATAYLLYFGISQFKKYPRALL